MNTILPSKYPVRTTIAPPSTISNWRDLFVILSSFLYRALDNQVYIDSVSRAEDASVECGHSILINPW